MFQIRMVGTTAQIYSDHSGILKDFQDIEKKLKKLSEQFQVDSVSIDDNVDLNEDHIHQLKSNFLLKKITEEINEESEQFTYLPISFQTISKEFLTLVSADYISLSLCFIPLIIASIAYNFLPEIILNNLNLNSIILLFSVIGILGLGYIKTITSLHHYFLYKGSQQKLFRYFLLSKKDFSFIISSFFSELRVLSILACFFVPIWLILTFSNIISTNSKLPILALIAFIFIVLHAYFSARYSLALPAIIANRKKCRTSWSYKMTIGNGWRIAFLVFIFPFILEWWLLAYINFETEFFLTLLIRILYLSISVGMLVLCFKHITDKCIKKNTSSN